MSESKTLSPNQNNNGIFYEIIIIDLQNVNKVEPIVPDEFVSMPNSHTKPNEKQNNDDEDVDLDLNISENEIEQIHFIPEASPKSMISFNKFKDLIKSEPVVNKTVQIEQKLSPHNMSSFHENPSYEKQIHSVELNNVNSPNSAQEKLLKERALETEFCKKYAGIKMAENASFSERMEFDIYKRATKDTRLDTLLKMQKPKLNKTQQEELFKRLIEDGKRRNQRTDALEKFKQFEREQTQPSTKRLNEKEFEEKYVKMMDHVAQREDKLKKQRIYDQALKEFKEKKIMEKGIAYNKKISSEGVRSMLERFQKDAERRDQELRVKKAQADELKKDQEKDFFKPKLIKPRTATGNSRLTSNNNIVNERKNVKIEDVSTPISMTTISEASANFTERLKQTQDAKPLSKVWENAKRKIEKRNLKTKKPPIVPKKTKSIPKAGASQRKNN